MHFSIPDTQQLCDDSGKYTGYNLHLNGEYHCSVRYKQLHNFNEQLKKLYGPENVPSFPPKKLFPLSVIQIEERRTHLEKYMQSCKNIIVVGNGGNSFYYMKRDGSSQITSPSISSTELDSNSSEIQIMCSGAILRYVLQIELITWWELD
ncbi:sorting nexin-17-like [Diaphorina citri]|uniref:Sorting nexin-17-like n=1 Tax=Diaphorina citri TaxID=121845 RepID=A0A1S3CWU3_DIACI|nr:sorting nexin-17-like [Diaphorina citri]